MLGPETVFVIGAGSSKELDLPIGHDLKRWIATVLRLDKSSPAKVFADQNVQDAVFSYVDDVRIVDRHALLQRYVEASRIITKALPFAFSIDQYLDAQRGDEVIVRMAKIGIAAAILLAEQNSKIGKPSNSATKLSDLATRFPATVPNTWHERLVQLLVAGKGPEHLDSLFDNVAFIIFNYDRCIEHYLLHALTAYYNVEETRIANAMRRLDIVHPYGQVGPLRWQEGQTVPFGAQTDFELRNVADDILTFTESANEGVTDRVQRLMSQANTVVFLGFGFLPQNVLLLTVPRFAMVSRVFFTCLGVSASDTEFVREDIENMLPIEPSLGRLDKDGPDFEIYEENATCRELIERHWMRLTR